MVPDHVTQLIQDHGYDVIVQSSDIRAFPADKYQKTGASVQEDLSPCSVVFAVKEIPKELFQPDTTYIFFAHVIKGQAENMPMLKRMQELKCQLIDYEKVTDDGCRRLISFGRHAGLAGMIDSLSALGQRLAWEDIPNPFHEIQQAHQYDNLDDAKEHIARVGERIRTQGVDARLCPWVVGFAGYGNVSIGAQEIFDLLPFEAIDPCKLQKLTRNGPVNSNTLYKVVFKEEHLVKPVSSKHRFELQEYYDHPEKYHSRFEDYLPHLTLLINANYWEDRYPRLVTKAGLKELFSQTTKPRLRVIGDISNDLEGAIECLTHTTDSGDPVYVYNPFNGETSSGVGGVGPVILAVSNLPCELPVESSTEFSRALMQFAPAIVDADYSVPFDRCNLPDEIKRALILYQGELTPDFTYLEQYVK